MVCLWQHQRIYWCFGTNGILLPKHKIAVVILREDYWVCTVEKSYVRGADVYPSQYLLCIEFKGGSDFGKNSP